MEGFVIDHQPPLQLEPDASLIVCQCSWRLDNVKDERPRQGSIHQRRNSHDSQQSSHGHGEPNQLGRQTASWSRPASRPAHHGDSFRRRPRPRHHPANSQSQLPLVDLYHFPTTYRSPATIIGANLTTIPIQSPYIVNDSRASMKGGTLAQFDDVVTSDGKLFQVLVAALGNARSPIADSCTCKCYAMLRFPPI